MAGTVSDGVLLTGNPTKDEDILICIEAATKEFDSLTQKRLLQAASYGMPFLKQQQASHSAAAVASSSLVAGGPLKFADGEFPPSEDNNGGDDSGEEVILLLCTKLINFWLPRANYEF